MTRLAQGAVLAAAAAALAGCAFDKPLVENRFGSISTQPAGLPAAVRVSVASADVPPKDAGDDGVAITALSDRGQAALIEQTKGSPPTTLKDDSDGGGGPDRVANHSNLKRRLVIAILPQTFLAPGDRIDAIRVTLAVDPRRSGGWRITSWTQAANGQTVIDIGSSSRTNSDKFTASSGVKLAHMLTDTQVGYEADRSSTQTVEVKDTTDFDAGVDSDGTAWLVETAGWRQSLAHNLSIDATVTAQPAEIASSTFTTAGKLTKAGANGAAAGPTPPAELELSETLVLAPRSPQAAVCGVAHLDYRIRHVVSGAGTFTESDDVVAFQEGSSDATFLLAPPSLEPGYGLWVGDSSVNYRRASADHPVGLRFRTLAEAAKFADWLRTTAPPKGQLKDAQLVLGYDRPLSPADIRAAIPGLLDKGDVQAAQQALFRGCPAPKG